MKVKSVTISLSMLSISSVNFISAVSANDFQEKLIGDCKINQMIEGNYVTIILRNCAEYRLIRGRWPSGLKFGDIPQD